MQRNTPKADRRRARDAWEQRQRVQVAQWERDGWVSVRLVGASAPPNQAQHTLNEKE
jgi:hypothetical protein